MSQLLLVFGATGQQDSSVIDYVLKDDDFSKRYKIRGITRNTTGSSAKSLESKGVEMVQADVGEAQTLKAALVGVHTVFANTTTVYDEKLYDRDVSAGKTIADACIAAGVEYIIYSSSTPAVKFTGRAVPAFDCKYVVEEYIRTLPVKSAFYVPGTFMQNCQGPQKPRPTDESGVYVMHSMIDPGRKLPMIDIVGDTGKFVGAILTNPDKYEGQNLYAASEMLTGQEIADTMTKATGKTVKYICHPEEVYKKFLPEVMQEPFCAMLSYLDDPGYYGPETEERVEWTFAQARGKLTTYEEF